jgi:methionine salvage enolase-phosphatase E1
MLLRINSPLALVRWLPIKEEEEKGIGYYLYSAGSLKYDSVFGEIQFQV